MAHFIPRLTLVTGGTGKTGRRIIERLSARGLAVRVGSRTAAPAFDWKDRATWGAALHGVDAVYISYQPDLAVPGASDDIAAFSAQARAAGVRRVVMLTGRGEEEAEQCEAIVQRAGMEWTIVRASWFNQNFSENFLIDAIHAGVVALPVGDVREPFIDADDIADVAVAALTEDGHVGQVYEVTGPDALTFSEAVDMIAGASGRAIQFMQITPQEYTDAMRAGGVPEDAIWLVNFLFTTVLDGRGTATADGVQRALGRPARDFASYARDTAATGVWHAEPVAES